MDIHSRLSPSFDANPTALIAWDGISGLWYTELNGVPDPDFVSAQHESLDGALEWARARVSRVVFQDADTTANPVVTAENDALLDRMRRQEIRPTPDEWPIGDVRLLRDGDLPSTMDGRVPLQTVESWYLVEMWSSGNDGDDDESWRIGGGNRVTDVLRWIANLVGRREWSLHLLLEHADGRQTSAWLSGDPRLGFWLWWAMGSSRTPVGPSGRGSAISGASALRWDGEVLRAG